MFSCDVCNGYKQHYPIVDLHDPSFRLLNCTKENEFPEHIVEDDKGHWLPKSPAGRYHIETLGLWDDVHVRRRLHRNKVLAMIAEIEGPTQFQGNLRELETSVRSSLQYFREEIKKQIPLPTEAGLQTF